MRLYAESVAWISRGVVARAFFLARDKLSALLCYRPSACPSVTRVDHSKTVEVRIMRFSPISIVFAG